MIIRRLRPEDERSELTFFRCSDGSVWQGDVEVWIRRRAYSWALSSNQHELNVLISDAGEVAGLYAFEPGAEEDEWFVKVVAVQAAYQNNQTNKFGTRLLGTCLDELSERGGIAVWHVDNRNEPAHRMSLRVGGHLDIAPPSALISRYFLPL